jgi:hypothetical protein
MMTMMIMVIIMIMICFQFENISDAKMLVYECL